MRTRLVRATVIALRLAAVTAAAVMAMAADARRALAAADADLAAALDLVPATVDVVAFDMPARPGAPRVRAVTTVRAPAAAVTAALLDPARFRAVIPAMIRSEVDGAQAPAGGARRIAWELEVPLFNLDGHMLLRPLPDGGVEMALADGDLAPGRVIFRVAPAGDGRTTRLEVDAVADVRKSSFFVRRMLARSPYGESAALAAAAWVAMRATALRAEHAGAPSAWRPAAPPAPPPAAWLPDARALADARLAPLRARGAVALVERAASERLAGVAVGREIAMPAATAAAGLRDPGWWRTFPGWRKVDVVAGAAGALAGAKVEDSIPFVDFDATWQGTPGGGLRWTAVAGAAGGARLGWDVFPVAGGAAAASVVVLTLYPRLEQTGGVPRRLIAAEPLLEHGLTLALAFVDAWTAVGSLESARSSPRTPAKPGETP